MLLPPDALLDIEQGLNKTRFLGAPIGPTLNNLFVVELFNGNARWDAAAVSMDFVRYIRHTLLPERRQVPLAPALNTAIHRDKVLCTWISERPNLNSLVLPVLDALNPERCVVIGSNDKMRQRLDANFAFVSWQRTPTAPRSSWYPAYLRCLPGWSEALLGTFRKHGIPMRLIPRIHTWLLCRARSIDGFRTLLRHLRPSAVVTEYDRNPHSSCLVLAANTLGIPTFTMLHGMIAAPIGFAPLAANTVFCWGDHSRNKMIELGVSPERIVVTGCHAVQRELGADRATALVKAGLPTDRPVVVLATNPIHPTHRSELFRAFCEGLAASDAITPVVRLHPSETAAFYSADSARYRRVRILENHVWSLDESLSAADVVVCHDTTYGLDAMVKRRPVVILDAISTPVIGARDLVERGGCPCVANPKELRSIVDRILGSERLRSELLTKADSYVSHVYSAFGSRAADALVSCVLEAARRRNRSRKNPGG